MPYQGNTPLESYVATVKDSFSGNGSTTAFTMSKPTQVNDVRVVVENVIQDPSVAYTVSGTTLTFTSAPPTGTNNIYVVHLGPAVMTTVPPAEIADATTFASSLTVQGAFTSKGIDDNADAVALTIDSSKNVLVGTTSDNQSIAGHGFKPDGFVYHTRDGGAMLRLNRLNSDGELMQIQKDGSTVGSIGVNNSDNLTVQGNSGHSGIEFGTNAIFPHKNSANVDNTIDLGEGSLRWKDAYLSGGVKWTEGQVEINSGRLLQRSAGDASGLRFDGSGYTPFKNGSAADGTVDLGYSGGRYKNLYLSGGVYLGGTVGANKLEDYEEGTWQPTFKQGVSVNSYAVQSGFYTKIGRVVHCEFYIQSTGSGATAVLQVQGLPFTSSSTTYARGGGTSSFQDMSFSSTFQFYGSNNVNHFSCYYSGSAEVTFGGSYTNKYLIGTYTYITDA